MKCDAGGKYDAGGSNYEFSLGLDGLGTCATQYASEYFDAVIRRDGYRYSLHFEKGKNIGGLKREPAEPEKDGLLLPLEAGPGGVYGD